MSLPICKWTTGPILVFMGPGSALAQVSATDAPRFVYVVPGEGVIDLGLAPYLRRVLDEAKEAGADAVVALCCGRFSDSGTLPSVPVSRQRLVKHRHPLQTGGVSASLSCGQFKGMVNS